VEFRHRPEPFANGGPALVLGGQLRTDAPGGTPLLGLGYEVGLIEHLVLSLWFETTFQAIAQSLILELVSPGFFILPSVAAGLGVVVTQLGPRGVDAALRLRFTVSTFAVGLVADFDYFPSDGSWNIGIAGRVGM
jgi:hypothetical protein